MPATHAHLYRAIAIQADAQGNLPTEIQLLTPGNWKTPWHGDFELTEADIAEFAAHFNAGIARVNKTEPLPINFDHGSGPAGGWIYGLESRGPDGLWGTNIKWTPLGTQKVKDREYAFFSPEFNTRDLMYEDPEEAGTRIPNVLSAAALTNSPLFKKLKPVMASEGDKQEGARMKLEDVRKKALADLDDAEKKFLTEHKDDLTADERKAFELQTDAEKTAEKDAADKAAADKEAADKAAAEKEKTDASAKVTTINASELAKLQADAAAGRQAADKLARNEASAVVKAHVARGAIKSGQEDKAVELLMASSPKFRTELEGFLTELPDNKLITAGELGNGGEGGDVAEADELDKLATDYATEHKVSYASAMKVVASQKPDLVKAATKNIKTGEAE